MADVQREAAGGTEDLARMSFADTVRVFKNEVTAEEVLASSSSIRKICFSWNCFERTEQSR